MEVNKLYKGDCLEIMKQIPDKSIDLVLTDPPYGIGINKTGAVGGVNSATKNAKLTQFKATNWDDKIPEKEYFDEIIRISKNQIIWGGNYFVQHLYNSSCWIVWDKNNEGTPFADCELAWTSFDTAVRKFKFTWNGMIQEDMKNKEVRHHPTQKPVELMKFCLDRYSKPGDTILDCFAGSGTTGIACVQTGRNYILIEKDEDYCNIIEKRLRNTTPPLFIM